MGNIQLSRILTSFRFHLFLILLFLHISFFLINKRNFYKAKKTERTYYFHHIHTLFFKYNQRSFLFFYFLFLTYSSLFHKKQTVGFLFLFLAQLLQNHVNLMCLWQQLEVKWYCDFKAEFLFAQKISRRKQRKMPVHGALIKARIICLTIWVF